MRHYLVIPIIAAALAGCAGLGDEDRALINNATQAAQDAKQQATEARQQAAQAAEDARKAREEASRAAADARAASEKADRIFRTGSRK